MSPSLFLPTSIFETGRPCRPLPIRIIAALRPIIIATSRPSRKFTPKQNVGAVPGNSITNFRPLFLFPPQQTMPALCQLHPRPVLSSHRGEQMATAAQAPATPATKDPVQSWLQRGAAVNRANSADSTGPRTESGKQRSSLNALSHGLTARSAVLPTEDPDAYQRHIQQFLDEYKPATPTETQLVHEIANTAWRLNRIPFLEAELLSQDPNPQSLIPRQATRACTVRVSRGWLRFFKTTSRAPRTTADAPPLLLQRPPRFPNRPATHGSRILRTQSSS